MAQSGDALEHPVTRERIVWRQAARETGGELLQFDLFMAPGGFVAAEHVHPKQEERFEVLGGSLRFRIDGKECTLPAGEGATVPAGRPHVFWNPGGEEGHILVEIRPSLRSEMFFETFFGLGKDLQTNRKGLPNPLRMAVVMREYGDEIRLAKPPPAVQRAIFTPLALLGRLLGYRGWYPRYTAAPLVRSRRADR